MLTFQQEPPGFPSVYVCRPGPYGSPCLARLVCLARDTKQDQNVENVCRLKEVGLFQSVTSSVDGWCPSPAGRRLYQNIDLAQSPARVIDII